MLLKGQFFNNALGLLSTRSGLELVPDGVVVMSSANGLVGTGFASWHRLQLRAFF